MLLRFLTSRIATIRSAANQQIRLGLVLEEKRTAPSMPKSESEWIGILGRTAKNEFDVSVGTNETIMVSESQCQFDVTSDTRCAERTEFKL